MTTHHPRQFPVILITGERHLPCSPCHLLVAYITSYIVSSLSLFLFLSIYTYYPGTPGTGKTTHAQMLASTSAFPFKHINVSELVTEKGFHEGLDEEWNSYTLDEDKVSTSAPRYVFDATYRRSIKLISHLWWLSFPHP